MGASSPFPEPDESRHGFASDETLSQQHSQLPPLTEDVPSESQPKPKAESSRWDGVADKLDDMLSGPRWARLAAGILILTVAIIGYVPQLREAIKQWRTPVAPYDLPSTGSHDASKDDPSSKAQTLAQTADYEHLNLHLTRGDGKVIAGSELLVGAATPDEIQVTYFSSDHCVRVHRHHGSVTQDKWEKDFSPASSTTPSSTATVLDFNEQNPIPQGNGRLTWASFAQPRLKTVQGRCLNPHPGPFRWWWGPANGCWVPMYRQFQDGCTHYQMFNSCTNFWDANISWTVCYH